MQVQLRTPFSELTFELTQENAESLVQTAFRLSSGMISTSGGTGGGPEKAGQADPSVLGATVADENASGSTMADDRRDHPTTKNDSGQDEMTMEQALQSDGHMAVYKASAPEDRYRGFLLIRCATCGERKCFNANSLIGTFRCEKCHQYTPLKDLTPVFAECECGKHWKYRTNETSDMIEISCLACGSPISLEYIARKKVYATIQPRY